MMDKLSVKTGLFYLLVGFGILSFVTGLVLFFWPSGPRAGWIFFMDLNKGSWSDIHSYLSLVLIPVAVLHLIENRRCVKQYVDMTMNGRKQTCSPTQST